MKLLESFIKPNGFKIELSSYKNSCFIFGCYEDEYELYQKRRKEWDKEKALGMSRLSFRNRYIKNRMDEFHLLVNSPCFWLYRKLVLRNFTPTADGTFNGTFVGKHSWSQTFMDYKSELIARECLNSWLKNSQGEVPERYPGCYEEHLNSVRSAYCCEVKYHDINNCIDSEWVV